MKSIYKDWNMNLLIRGWLVNAMVFRQLAENFHCHKYILNLWESLDLLWRETSENHQLVKQVRGQISVL